MFKRKFTLKFLYHGRGGEILNRIYGIARANNIEVTKVRMDVLSHSKITLKAPTKEAKERFITQFIDTTRNVVFDLEI